jgi:hypothetical protein
MILLHSNKHPLLRRKKRRIYSFNRNYFNNVNYTLIHRKNGFFFLYLIQMVLGYSDNQDLTN